MTRRHALSGKDVRALSREVDLQIKRILEEAETVEMWEVDDKTVLYLVDGKPLFARMKIKLEDTIYEKYVPLLTMFYLANPEYPYVRVDEGAVPRILNGADVMRPGIKEFKGEFNRGDIVAVRDPKDRTIAVTVALVSRSECEQMQRGKVLKNIHYLGDKLSKIVSELMKTKA